jgi:hypothetical protein
MPHHALARAMRLKVLDVATDYHRVAVPRIREIRALLEGQAVQLLSA